MNSHPFDKIVKKLLPAIPLWLKPNHFTMSRVFLTIFFIWLFINDYRISALLAFILAAMTDAIDGALARERNLISRFGAVVDPWADKLLILSALVVLQNYLNIYLVAILIFLEILALISSLVCSYSKTAFNSNIWGKIKMTLETLLICLLFVYQFNPGRWLFNLNNSLLIVIIIFALIAIFDYSKSYKNI